MADIPAGTGLGSSGSFTTALLKALQRIRNIWSTPRNWPSRRVPSKSIDSVSPSASRTSTSPPTAAFTCFTFLPNGKVEAWPLRIDQDTLYGLEDNLLLFFTGYSRAASDILREQDTKSQDDDQDMTENLHFIKDLGYQSKAALEAGDLHVSASS